MIPASASGVPTLLATLSSASRFMAVLPSPVVRPGLCAGENSVWGWTINPLGNWAGQLYHVFQDSIPSKANYSARGIYRLLVTQGYEKASTHCLSQHGARSAAMNPKKRLWKS